MMMRGSKSWLAVRQFAKCYQHVSNKRYLNTDVLEVSEEVQRALRHGLPVVALESTIITHGMPHPHNLRTALSVEQIVQEHGAVPATIAVLDGRLHVGLSNNQLHRLASCQDVVKISRRDLAWALSQCRIGGTTVAGTMIAAHLAGIKIFVTGGIGGVHRGGEKSFDISSDLRELGRTPVTVVCAGVKSILDVGRTLEYLETEGVTVATFGDSKYFPAFYAATSAYQSPCNVLDATEAAQVIVANQSLELNSGILIAVPIPECSAKDSVLIEDAIKEAISEAESVVQVGKDVTPYILNRVNELTNGKALHANIALVENNAKIGSEIAVEYSKICSQRSFRMGSAKGGSSMHIDSSGQGVRRPVVIGASIYDFNVITHTDNVIFGGTTNPGSIQQGVGGVGRNIADCLTKLGIDPIFVSIVGDDLEGQSLINQSSHMDTSCISVLPGERTASYCVGLNGNGDVFLGVGDMRICDELTPEHVNRYKEAILQAPLVCLDGNIPTNTIQYVCNVCSENSIPVWYEPTCALKAIKPFEINSGQTLTYVSPNWRELQQMFTAIKGQETPSVLEAKMSLADIIQECHQICRVLIDHGLHCIILTLGADGVLICRHGDPDAPFPCGQSMTNSVLTPSCMSLLHYPACTKAQLPKKIVSVSGAGDCLAAGIIAGILKGHEPDICIKTGLLAANHSIQSIETIPHTLKSQDFSVMAIQAWAPWSPNRIM